MSKIIKLEDVPPPKYGTKRIFSTNDKNPLIRGFELESHVCGQCGFVLAENVIMYNYSDKVLQCPNCNSYNDRLKDWLMLLLKDGLPK